MAEYLDSTSNENVEAYLQVEDTDLTDSEGCNITSRH